MFLRRWRRDKTVRRLHRAEARLTVAQERAIGLRPEALALQREAIEALIAALTLHFTEGRAIEWDLNNCPALLPDEMFSMLTDTLMAVAAMRGMDVRDLVCAVARNAQLQLMEAEEWL